MAQSLLQISSYIYQDEISHVNKLLDYIDIPSYTLAAVNEKAIRLAGKIRESKKEGLETFLQQYNLSTEEGVAVMCLAESLLRIPDQYTAKLLLEDKLAGKNWRQHLGKSKSWLVNASSFGLLLSGKVMDYSRGEGIIAGVFEKLGEPLLLKAVKTAIGFMSDKFILGKDLAEGVKNAKKSLAEGYNLSFDILGESARTERQADGYYQAYIKALQDIATVQTENKAQRLNLSVKLSALHPKVLMRQEKELMAILLPRLEHIVKLCQELAISISFDAEESYRQDIYLLVLEKLLEKAPHFQGISFVVQGYSKRAFYIIDWIAEQANKRGHRISVRLVKGAYWDAEIKYAQEHGLPGYPVFTKKEHTDISYMACAKKMLQYQQEIAPQFATHNAYTVAWVMHLAGARRDFEFQRLQGMGEALHQEILALGYQSRIYAPIGHYEDLLAYLMRRLLENGANSSFVNLIANHEISVAECVKSPLPINEVQIALPLPQDIYSGRKNSLGVDCGVLFYLQQIQKGVQEHFAKQYQAYSIVNGEDVVTKNHSQVLSPSDPQDVIGNIYWADDSALENALLHVKKAQSNWENYAEKKTIMHKFANLLQEKREEIYSLLLREGGKNIDDAINELREAIDFVRYYTEEASALQTPQALPGYTGEENTISWHARGTFVVISPWNFPLAIFVGQLIAALVSGNTVIAKSASHTSIIAHYVVRLLIAAGLPKDVVALLIVSGSKFSKKIIADPAINGVCFTGSNKVALDINRTLAARDTAIAPLIAETGGQNAMIVDSSALLEQAADAIISSAFGSAGQRCSALRVLYVQEEIYAPLVALLKGAADLLKIGDVKNFITDVGPVIDHAAKQSLLLHVEKLLQNEQCELLYVHPQHEEVENMPGSFIAPRMIKVPHIETLTEEQFGPILHIITYKAYEIEHVIEQMNSTGFGLTFGIQSRIMQQIHHVLQQVKVGNAYANRSMTGAQVATHPFGGEGLSGTGFKAGGPHYLMRFMVERVQVINSSAIGGNIKLLSSAS